MLRTPNSAQWLLLRLIVIIQLVPQAIYLIQMRHVPSFLRSFPGFDEPAAQAGKLCWHYGFVASQLAWPSPHCRVSVASAEVDATVQRGIHREAR